MSKRRTHNPKHLRTAVSETNPCFKVPHKRFGLVGKPLAGCHGGDREASAFLRERGGGIGIVAIVAGPDKLFYTML